MPRRTQIPAHVTIRDKYKPALSLYTQPEAKAYFESCVEHAVRYAALAGKQLTLAEAEAQECSNLLCFAGWYGEQDQARVKHLFGFTDAMLPEAREKRIGF